MKKIGLLYLTAIFGGFLCAMENTFEIPMGLEDAHSYKGQLITPENISKLVPQIPKKIDTTITKWTSENHGMLKVLARQSQNISMSQDQIVKELIGSSYILGINSINFKKRELTINAQKISIPQQASYMIALPEEIDGKKYFAQLSGPIHKKHNLLSFNGKPWDGQLDPNVDKKMATFQTISRALGALKCHEVIEKEKIKNFYVPKTYLAQIPGRSDFKSYACDENTVVIQEDRGDNWITLRENIQVFPLISPQTIEETYKVIKEAILWDIKGNGLFNTYNYHLGQSDLEQPNDQNPELFAYAIPKNLTRKIDSSIAEHVTYKWAHDILCGLIGFAELLQKAKSKHNVTSQINAYKKSLLSDEQIKEFPKDLQARIYTYMESL
ncbi:MAG: hypothetical protein WDZ41_03070 [Candidatus Babeliales bacterium]